MFDNEDILEVALARIDKLLQENAELRKQNEELQTNYDKAAIKVGEMVIETGKIKHQLAELKDQLSNKPSITCRKCGKVYYDLSLFPLDKKGFGYKFKCSCESKFNKLKTDLEDYKNAFESMAFDYNSEINPSIPYSDGLKNSYLDQAKEQREGKDVSFQKE